MSVSNENFSTAAGPIPIEVYSPSSGAKHAVVLIFHGTLELDPPFGAAIVSFAEELNKKGIAAAIPRYFKSTKTKPGDEALQGIFTHLPAWKTTCRGALDFIKKDSRFDATRIGLLGFSLGGHLALNLAMDATSAKSVKCVVDFFAPTIQPALDGAWSALPPLLIHHGTADPLGIDNSTKVVLKLAGVGRTVTPLTFGKAAPAKVNDDRFIQYPGEGHGFKGTALVSSRETTVQFLETHLK